MGANFDAWLNSEGVGIGNIDVNSAELSNFTIESYNDFDINLTSI